MTLLDMPKKDFELFRIFLELFVFVIDSLLNLTIASRDSVRCQGDQFPNSKFPKSKFLIPPGEVIDFYYFGIILRKKALNT
jgi:hypothetical protein